MLEGLLDFVLLILLLLLLLLLVQVSQILRRFASGPAGEIPPGESIVKRCWRPGSSAEVSLTLFG